MNDNDTSLSGKVALITGAGSGIGRSVARQLAAQGAIVVGVDRDAEGLAETGAHLDPPMTALVADLADPQACAAVVADTVATHGRLDILGNIAGIAASNHFTDVTEAQYRLMMAVNADACFFLAQAAVPHLLETDGTIVSLASTASVIGQAYTVPYCMSKAAVVQLTKALAAEYMKTGLRVNAIAPGAVMTALARNYSAPADLDPELTGRYISPRGAAEADEIAAMFVHLCGPASRSIHGAVISMDQGITIC